MLNKKLKTNIIFFLVFLVFTLPFSAAECQTYEGVRQDAKVVLGINSVDKISMGQGQKVQLEQIMKEIYFKSFLDLYGGQIKESNLERFIKSYEDLQQYDSEEIASLFYRLKGINTGDAIEKINQRLDNEDLMRSLMALVNTIGENNRVYDSSNLVSELIQLFEEGDYKLEYVRAKLKENGFKNRLVSSKLIDVIIHHLDVVLDFKDSGYDVVGYIPFSLKKTDDTNYYVDSVANYGNFIVRNSKGFSYVAKDDMDAKLFVGRGDEVDSVYKKNQIGFYEAERLYIDTGKRELLANNLANQILFGLQERGFDLGQIVPTSIVLDSINGRNVVLSEYMQGTSLSENVQGGMGEFDLKEELDQNTLWFHRMLTLALLNIDAHLNNFLVKDDKVIGFDHGLSGLEYNDNIYKIIFKLTLFQINLGAVPRDLLNVFESVLLEIDVEQMVVDAGYEGEKARIVSEALNVQFQNLKANLQNTLLRATDMEDAYSFGISPEYYLKLGDFNGRRTALQKIINDEIDSIKNQQQQQQLSKQKQDALENLYHFYEGSGLEDKVNFDEFYGGLVSPSGLNDLEKLLVERKVLSVGILIRKLSLGIQRHKLNLLLDEYESLKQYHNLRNRFLHNTKWKLANEMKKQIDILQQNVGISGDIIDLNLLRQVDRSTALLMAS